MSAAGRVRGKHTYWGTANLFLFQPPLSHYPHKPSRLWSQMRGRSPCFQERPTGVYSNLSKFFFGFGDVIFPEADTLHCMFGKPFALSR